MLGFECADGGEGRLCRRNVNKNHHPFGCQMGCTAAPWTGSMLLKQSCVECALEDGEVPIDMNGPPDALACVTDGVERGTTSLQDALKPFKRVFVCGLALDFCVLDTCLNASSAEMEGPAGGRKVYMVFDAARAALAADVRQLRPCRRRQGPRAPRSSAGWRTSLALLAGAADLRRACVRC